VQEVSARASAEEEIDMSAASVGLAPKLWRVWLAWKFRVWQRHRHRRLILEHVDGLPMLVLPDVFNPTLFFSSEALARILPRVVKPGCRVLDMGTGSGVQAIVAAGLGAQVVAVDVSAEAVRCACINALLNGMEKRIEVREGDLFAPVAGERFDLVLFNPPFYHGQPAQTWEVAWRSTDVLDRFAAGLGAALFPSGRALLVVSSNAAGVEEAVARHGLCSRLVWERNLRSESMMILEWTPPAPGEEA
jgi:release factor glutamine methyltransferase